MNTRNAIVKKLFPQESGNTDKSPRLRIVDRECEFEVDCMSDISNFEQDFLVAFHDICREFLQLVLLEQKVSNLEDALRKGLIDLDAFSVYLEYCSVGIINGYKKVFPQYGGIDLCNVGIHTVYDNKHKDIVCKISFFR